jgi:3-oxoacyl-[acyl-carrier protein] reductase
MNIDFVNKVGVVIGGSRGIGAAICCTLLGAGGDVALTHLGSEDDLKGVLKLQALASSRNRRCLDRIVDCTDAKGTADFINEVISQMRRVDYLIYCAGFTSPVKFNQLTVDQWRRVIDINLNGAFIILHSVLPHMVAAGSGSVVLIGSAAITSGGGGRADYVSAKAGLEGLNLAVTREYSPKGIRCNLVHPSLIETDLLRQRHPDVEKRQQLAVGVPLGRLGQAEDVANMVCFLLSEKASYVTGQSILVDGGRSYCGK